MELSRNTIDYIHGVDSLGCSDNGKAVDGIETLHILLQSINNMDDLNKLKNEIQECNLNNYLIDKCFC